MSDAPNLVIVPEVHAAGARLAAYDREGVPPARAMRS